MRVLYIGNAGQKSPGANYYSSHRRAVNGLRRSGHDVLHFSDRDRLRTKRPLPFAARRVNVELLRIARGFQPEALILCCAEIVTNETLEKLKAASPGVRIAQINIDCIFNPDNARRFRARRGYVDMQFFTTAGDALAAFATAGAPCYFIPQLVDSSIDTGRAFALDAPAYDLTCTMTVDPRFEDSAWRQSLALGLKRNLPELATCYRGFGGHPPLYGRAYIEAYGNSAMALNLSQTMSGNVASTEAERYLYSSNRIAHIIGNGALAFIPDEFGLDELYPDAVFFSGLDELTDKVRFYWDRPEERQAIAWLSWRRAHAEFDSARIMRYVLDRIFERPPGRDYAWPVRPVFAAA
ncbi:MAG: glycosyltransferase [Alphaproteobacteria bacterium]